MLRRGVKIALVAVLCALPVMSVMTQTKTPVSDKPFPEILFQLLGPGDGSLLRWRREFRLRSAGARGAEAALYRRLQTFVQKLEKGAPMKIRAIVVEYHGILMEASRVWSHDLHAQARIGAFLISLAHTMEGARMSGPAIAPEVSKQIGDFVKAFHRWHPNRADANGLRGDLCSLNAPGDIACMKHYLKCLRLNAGRTSCRAAYDRFIDFYKRPRCEGTDIAAVRLVSITRSKTAGEKPFYRGAGGDWYRAAGLHDIVGVEIAEIVEQQSPHGPRSLVTLKAAGARKLQVNSEHLAPAGGRIAIMRGREILATPAIVGRLTTPRIVLGLSPEKLCMQTRRRTVPLEYRR